MEDSKIIELFNKRDEKAIAQTKEQYGKQLRALAYRILRNTEDAEECENDTYLKAWRSIPPQQPTYLFAYLSRMCRNNALQRLERSQAKKRCAEIVELSDELAACLPDNRSLQEMEERELAEIISTFLRTLSQESRMIFVRRYYLSESVTDITEALKVSESKVKSSLFRTRNKLKKYLSKEEYR